MNTQYVWSNFCIRIQMKDGNIILKSTLTSSVVQMSEQREKFLDQWIKNPVGEQPPEIAQLLDRDVALLITSEYNEYAGWRTRLIERRNDEAHIFILHFLPTIACQLECGYCFENGGVRMKGMEDGIIAKSREWLDNYLTTHPEIDTFRLVLFGGEPLLRKDVVAKALSIFYSLAQEHRLKFWSELTSNGELLDEETAALLAKYKWLRVQITLDGPQDVHDARRHGRNKRPTFINVIRNIKMLLATDYIQKVDIRISLDLNNADRVPELIKYLVTFGAQERINLSLGLIAPTFNKPEQVRWDEERTLGKKAVEIWRVAQELGFRIPDDFITGPWCVAIAKHSVILQPNGALQKCFCTAGRSEYDFGTVAETPIQEEYLKDVRFEQWKRTDQCIEEKCQFLPMCGGGCIHDAVVAYGGQNGFDKRFCQKALLDEYNHGLLKLNYG